MTSKHDPPSSSTPRQPLTVVLFRKPSTGPDAYEAAFEEAGYEPITIPVLTERFLIDELRDVLVKGGIAWAAVIISSKRGAEGWLRAAKAVQDSSVSGDFIPDWSETPVFTVGQSALDVVKGSPHHSRLMPEVQRAQIAHSAEALVPLLLDCQSEEQRSYLLIRGDRSLDIIPEALRRADRAFKEVIVYETSEDPRLASTLGALADDIRGKSVWFAFFSPSSAEMTLHHLRTTRLSSSVNIGTLDEAQGSRPKIAAIGQTTGSYLESEGLRTNAVAKIPNAAGLLQAVQMDDSHA